MKDKNKLSRIIEKHVAEPYKDSLINEILPSIRLKTTGEMCNEIGKTKLGGQPDLPKDITWARSEYYEEFLSFLGQVNLAEVTKYDESGLLPKEGVLYFFFNLASADDGKVIFTKNTDLQRLPYPEEFEIKKKSFFQRLIGSKTKAKKVTESRVDISTEYHFPSWDSLTMEKIKKKTGTEVAPANAFDDEVFETMYDEGETDTTSNHHLVGHYQGIQNEYLELIFVDGEKIAFENIELATLKEALKWKLLFQFDSDNQLDVQFGDRGRVYFFIHEEDLKNQNFEHVKILADSY